MMHEHVIFTILKANCSISHTFLFLANLSELKELSSSAKNRLRTRKLSMMSAGKNRAMQALPLEPLALMQSHKGSIHSPHKMRKVSKKE